MLPDPTTPPAHDFVDRTAQLSFRVPAGWQVSRRDGDFSTLRLDARTAPRRSKLIAVAMMDFNPFPKSTFAGALFYVSAAPALTAAACAEEAHAKPNAALPDRPVGDVRFARGRDEHGKICTEERDTVYTAMRHGVCLRLDLAVNTFCGGEVSGARDMTDEQIGNIEGRLDGILDSLQFSLR